MAVSFEPKTPAQERRIKFIRFSPELLDDINGNACIEYVENALPDDAEPVGLAYDFAWDTFRVYISSSKYEITPECAVYEAVLEPRLCKVDGAKPIPFFQKLEVFVTRAKRSVSCGTCLADVIILPRQYQEGLCSD